MTTNESRIYGGLLILASFIVIALVILWAPKDLVTKCDGYNLNISIFKQIDDEVQIQSDTFEIDEYIIIQNETIGTESAEWLLSKGANIRTKNAMGVILSYATEGEKEIRLRINNREECTTEAFRIFIKPKCNDGIQNGSETDIDCGGGCPPCDGAIESNPTPPESLPPIPLPDLRLPTCYDGIQNGAENGIDCGGNCPPCTKGNEPLPTANIQHVGGPLKCNEYVTFDCGIPNRYNPAWSFDDLRTKQFFGTRVTHKFRNSSPYTIRIYINNRVVGQKTFNIADCSNNPFSSDSPPPPKGTTTTNPSPVSNTAKGYITMSGATKCNEKITFYSNTPKGTVVRWIMDNANDYRGANIGCTFKKSGAHTIKLYVGSNSTPSDTKTFMVTCEGLSQPTSLREIDLGIKAALQDISNEAHAGGVVTKGKLVGGRRYKNIIRDSRMCSKGRTKVKVNDIEDRTLDSYFDIFLIDGDVIIDKIEVQKNGNCIEKIYIYHRNR